VSGAPCQRRMNERQRAGIAIFLTMAFPRPRTMMRF
jgi:hypothetical protein